MCKSYAEFEAESFCWPGNIFLLAILGILINIFFGNIDQCVIVFGLHPSLTSKERVDTKKRESVAGLFIKLQQDF